MEYQAGFILVSLLITATIASPVPQAQRSPYRPVSYAPPRLPIYCVYLKHPRNSTSIRRRATKGPALDPIDSSDSSEQMRSPGRYGYSAGMPASNGQYRPVSSTEAPLKNGGNEDVTGSMEPQGMEPQQNDEGDGDNVQPVYSEDEGADEIGDKGHLDVEEEQDSSFEHEGSYEDLYYTRNTSGSSWAYNSSQDVRDKYGFRQPRNSSSQDPNTVPRGHQLSQVETPGHDGEKSPFEGNYEHDRPEHYRPKSIIWIPGSYPAVFPTSENKKPGTSGSEGHDLDETQPEYGDAQFKHTVWPETTRHAFDHDGSAEDVYSTEVAKRNGSISSPPPTSTSAMTATLGGSQPNNKGVIQVTFTNDGSDLPPDPSQAQSMEGERSPNVTSSDSIPVVAGGRGVNNGGVGESLVSNAHNTSSTSPEVSGADGGSEDGHVIVQASGGDSEGIEVEYSGPPTDNSNQAKPTSSELGRGHDGGDEFIAGIDVTESTMPSPNGHSEIQINVSVTGKPHDQKNSSEESANHGKGSGKGKQDTPSIGDGQLAGSYPNSRIPFLLSGILIGLLAVVALLVLLGVSISASATSRDVAVDQGDPMIDRDRARTSGMVSYSLGNAPQDPTSINSGRL